MTLAFGDRLGPYEVLGLVGVGFTGEVYSARDPRLGRDVAIRLLAPYFSSDAEGLRRIEREARTTGSLNHPSLPSLYDVGTHDGRTYLVSELLTGTTLARSLETSLPLQKAVDLAGQVAQGLAAAHAHGIVHRDLRPLNLFVTTDGRVKILDFGLSYSGPEVFGASASRVAYLAPEQAKAQRVDHRADIFAFGCVLYEMLTGRRAFERETFAATLAAIVTDEPADLGTLPVPPRLARIVKRCLEKEPAQRVQSAQDLAFALKTLSGEALLRSDIEHGRQTSDSGSGPSQNPAPAAAPRALAVAPAIGRGRRRAIWAVLLLAAAAAAVALILSVSGHGRRSGSGAIAGRQSAST